MGLVLVEAKGFTTAVLLLKSLPVSDLVLPSIRDFRFLLVSWRLLKKKIAKLNKSLRVL